MARLSASSLDDASETFARFIALGMGVPDPLPRPTQDLTSSPLDLRPKGICRLWKPASRLSRLKTTKGPSCPSGLLTRGFRAPSNHDRRFVCGIRPYSALNRRTEDLCLDLPGWLCKFCERHVRYDAFARVFAALSGDELPWR